MIPISFDLETDVFRPLQFLVSNLGEVLVAGGAARAALTGEPIADFDIFLDESDPDANVGEYARTLEEDDWKILFRCPAGELVTLEKDGIRVQVIRKLAFGSALELLDQFDFTICQFAVLLKADFSQSWDVKEGRPLQLPILSTTSDALVDTFQKRLRLARLTYPVSTLSRIQKFRERGFRAGPALYREIVLAILEAGSFDEDQLTLYSID